MAEVDQTGDEAEDTEEDGRAARQKAARDRLNQGSRLAVAPSRGAPEAKPKKSGEKKQPADPKKILADFDAAVAAVHKLVEQGNGQAARNDAVRALRQVNALVRVALPHLNDKDLESFPFIRRDTAELPTTTTTDQMIQQRGTALSQQQTDAAAVH
jgi:hypothetical protein